MSRTKIGLFGGTFDPPHIGHLILASEAVHQLRLSRLLWMLAPDPPHKLEQPITPFPHRLEMLKRAIDGNPSFEISYLEAERPGPHYTVDTVQILSQLEPDVLEKRASNLCPGLNAKGIVGKKIKRVQPVGASSAFSAISLISL